MRSHQIRVARNLYLNKPHLANSPSHHDYHAPKLSNFKGWNLRFLVSFCEMKWENEHCECKFYCFWTFDSWNCLQIVFFLFAFPIKSKSSRFCSWSLISTPKIHKFRTTKASFLRGNFFSISTWDCDRNTKRKNDLFALMIQKVDFVVCAWCCVSNDVATVTIFLVPLSRLVAATSENEINFAQTWRLETKRSRKNHPPKLWRSFDDMFFRGDES